MAKTKLSLSKEITTAYSIQAIQNADFVVYRGQIVKNRYGLTGSTNVPIPDGCYKLEKINDGSTN